MILPTIHFLIRYFFQHYHQITYFYINIYTKFNSTKKKKKKNVRNIQNRYALRIYFFDLIS